MAILDWTIQLLGRTTAAWPAAADLLEQQPALDTDKNELRVGAVGGSAWSASPRIGLPFQNTMPGSPTNDQALTALGIKTYVDNLSYSAKLAAIEALTWAADRGIYLTGTNTAATFDLSSFARTILDDANAAAVLATIGAYASTTKLNAIAAPDGSVDINSQNLINLADPASAQDAATKAYVDSLAAGLRPKASVRAISTSNITLSGAQTIDGVSIIAGDRVLVAGQSTGANNGIYVCAAGTWSRATDADTSAEVKGGLFCFVEEGTTYADCGFVLSTNNPITLGSTTLTFTQFSSAGLTVDGSGLTKTGNTFDVNTDGTTIEISSDALRIKDLGVSTAKLAAGAVTLAKMADMATASLLGRSTAGTGAPEVLSASTVRTLLSLVPGTDVHAYSAVLAAIAATTNAADKGVQFSGGGVATTYDLKFGNEAAYTGTLTWTAGVAPSGASSLRQFWERNGNRVMWQIMLTFANAGTTVTNLSLTFPTEFPTPAIPTGFTGADVRLYSCDATRLLATPTTTMTNAAVFMIMRNAADNGFVIASTAAFTSGTYRTFILSGAYFTS